MSDSGDIRTITCEKGDTMDGEIRRKKIMERLSTCKEPIAGAVLAKEYQVSRQVIVQDIALLRATNKNILSTNKGYVLFENGNQEKTYKKSIAVKHTDEQIKDELYTIVDAGGKVLDVVVEHDIYGQISVDLVIQSRVDVDEFVENVIASKIKPLKLLTNDIHYHTVEASKEEILEEVTKGLEAKGYLISC